MRTYLLAASAAGVLASTAAGQVPAGEGFAWNFITVADPFGAAAGGNLSSHSSLSAVFGTPSTASGPTLPAPLVASDITVTTSQTSVDATTNRLLITFASAGDVFFPATLTIGGAPINRWVFDIGNLFSGTDNGILDPNFVAIVTDTVEYFDGATSVISFSNNPSLVTNSNTTDGIAGQYSVAVGAGGDIGTTGIDRAEISIDYTIPAPGSAAVIGLGGLLAARRRR